MVAWMLEVFAGPIVLAGGAEVVNTRQLAEPRALIV
jgi:hypothetical protein